MADSLSSDNIPPRKYDVFLCFRGEDTRRTFISHLYTALIRKQIKTFFDNELIRGAEIPQALVNAIEGSKISVVILSQWFASSSWCLDELVKILECKKKYGQIVIPVFYGVHQSHVRHQTGPFGEAFSFHEERFKERLDRPKEWRIALTEVANLAGFDSNSIRLESMLIEKIIEDILKKLNDIFPSDVVKDLVGIESYIKEIESLLSYGSIDIDTLGVWGLGGIGKTTIISAIFSKISKQFEGSFFVHNIREESEKIGGLAHLRHRLLSTILTDENLTRDILNFGVNFGSEILTRKKVLIVFDDVTGYEQIEFLIGSPYWFMPGSLIIITTRNKQVLQNCGVKKIYKMKDLAYADAFRLFSRQAFKQNHPDVGYEELSNKVIQYANGVPLAIKVLGSLLSGRSKEIWKSEIRELKKTLPKDIQKVLKISYDDLNAQEQNIFLHIACFPEEEDLDFVTKFLNANGFSAEIGISVLVDKSLIVVSQNKITMHYLLKQMGREIAPQEYINDVRKSIDDLRKGSRIELEKIFVITNFVLELPAAVFDQLSSVHKPQYAITTMSLSFAAMVLCIVELGYQCGKEKVTWKWRSTLPWLYYPSKTRNRPFGNLENIIQLIGLACAVCQCIFAAINYDFVRQHANNPVKISFWPIVFAFGLLCSKLLEKPVRRSRSTTSSTSRHCLQEVLCLNK